MWATDVVYKLCAAPFDLSSLFANQSRGGFSPKGRAATRGTCANWMTSPCSSGG
jgi:hypothetical protein